MSKADLINRQDAIDALREQFKRNTPIAIRAKLTVEGVPSAQPEPQWIPCSERLPEEDQICIVTDDTQRCAYEYGFHNDTYDEVNGWTYLGHKIIAWMPLPEPYKGES